jgi:hypothetical protein
MSPSWAAPPSGTMPLTSVTHDGTLPGARTSSSPLRVVAPTIHHDGTLTGDGTPSSPVSVVPLPVSLAWRLVGRQPLVLRMSRSALPSARWRFRNNRPRVCLAVPRPFLARPKLAGWANPPRLGGGDLRPTTILPEDGALPGKLPQTGPVRREARMRSKFDPSRRMAQTRGFGAPCLLRTVWRVPQLWSRFPNSPHRGKGNCPTLWQEPHVGRRQLLDRTDRAVGRPYAVGQRRRLS